MKEKKNNEIKEINNFEDMDTKTLFKEFKKTKDKKIRDLLIERHLYIAEILAKKYR